MGKSGINDLMLAFQNHAKTKFPLPKVMTNHRYSYLDTQTDKDNHHFLNVYESHSPLFDDAHVFSLSPPSLPLSLRRHVLR